MKSLNVLTAALVATIGGCGWLPDAYSGCDEIQPYELAREDAPLEVPAGAGVPDTRNALDIPRVTAPELPPEPGRCLEHPPPFGRERPQAASDN